MNKTLFVLGGAQKTLPLVRYARSRGHKVLLSDRNEDPPCRALASDFVQVSTSDLPALRAVMRERKVDGVVSFGSDLMAVITAQLAEEFGLPGNPVRAMEILSRKDLFRTWLDEQGFPVPSAASFSAWPGTDALLASVSLPLMVKPVDAAGSTAVERVCRSAGLAAAFERAMQASRDRRVIVEEYIERDHPNMIGGDLFVHAGEVTFWGLVNSHRANPSTPYLPTGTSHPLRVDGRRLELLRELCAEVVHRLGLCFGGFNVEAMFGLDGQLYLIELAPRNGGNAIPELLLRATGFDLVGALVDTALGEPNAGPTRLYGLPVAVSNYMVHSNVPGRFVDLHLAPEIVPHVVGCQLDVLPGEPVEVFDRATRVLGRLDLEFDDSDQQEELLARMSQLVSVQLE